MGSRGWFGTKSHEAEITIPMGRKISWGDLDGDVMEGQ